MSDEKKVEQSGIILICLMPFAFIWQGFLVVGMWTWFIAPIVSISITIPEAIGISLVIRMLTGGRSDDNYDTLRTFLHWFVLPLIVYAIAWVTHFFV